MHAYAHLGAHAACVTVRLHAERPCVRIQIQLLGYSLDRAWLTRRHANERESGATYGGRAREIFLVLVLVLGEKKTRREREIAHCNARPFGFIRDTVTRTLAEAMCMLSASEVNCARGRSPMAASWGRAEPAGLCAAHSHTRHGCRQRLSARKPLKNPSSYYETDCSCPAACETD
jgi:hypothetical protein